MKPVYSYFWINKLITPFENIAHPAKKIRHDIKYI